jgi:hypothetical protein
MVPLAISYLKKSTASCGFVIDASFSVHREVFGESFQADANNL